MSYLLGSITLPRPAGFQKEVIETAQKIMTLAGATKKDYTNRKYRYVLEFKYLTQAEVSQILSEYDLQVTRNFSSTETNNTIASTPVHIEIERREYNTPGNEYREDITLYLEEAQ